MSISVLMRKDGWLVFNSEDLLQGLLQTELLWLTVTSYLSLCLNESTWLDVAYTFAAAAPVLALFF